MVQSLRPRLTAAHKTERWRRWRHGESLNAIGRALGRIAHVVRYEVARTGGIPPPARQRSRLALTLTEREAISRGLACGTSVRQISRQLRRAPSTVSREVRRHGGRRRYRAATADVVAWARGRRPKRCRLATPPALRDAVATKRAQQWSPQQIAGWLRQAYPEDPTRHVSHETIYLSLFVQSRGVRKKALQAQWRQRRTSRRPRAAAPKTGGYIVGAVSMRIPDDREHRFQSNVHTDSGHVEQRFQDGEHGFRGTCTLVGSEVRQAASSKGRTQPCRHRDYR